MRVAIVSDAWRPQTNGVVTTIEATVRELGARNHEARVFSPAGRVALPCPSYPEIRLAVAPHAVLQRELLAFRPEALHICTEGPMGLAARRVAIEQGWAFTTSYHTRYPEYLAARWPIPPAVSYAWLRWFHGAAARTFVSSPSLVTDLLSRGFERLHLWQRGVDRERFFPLVRDKGHPLVHGLPRPLMTYVGRVAVEKNLEAFLGLELPGTKLVIGDGPAAPELLRRYPAACFAGYRFGQELTQLLASADVFVFPSRTDTFGLAMLEALACGVPVAAFPVPGPIDVVEPGVTGVLDADLAAAIEGALRLDRTRCAREAGRRTWQAATEQFLAGLTSVCQGAPHAAARPLVRAFEQVSRSTLS